jgi:hypothetical protein
MYRVSYYDDWTGNSHQRVFASRKRAKDYKTRMKSNTVHCKHFRMEGIDLVY